MDLIDTHCHIDLDAFEADRDAVIHRAREAGARRMVLVAFAPERWGTCFDLAAAYDGMFVAVGLHPTEAERYDDALESELRALAVHPAVVAIGETGIDYHWETAAPAVQRKAFARQIALAKALGLPFIIHQRDAANDVLAVLREAGPPHRGVMHCFTGDRAYAEACLALGLHLGVGGAVTHRKARHLREAVAGVPLDRLILETDAPYMTPSPHRGERNEPAYVRLVAEHVAALRGIPVDEVASATTRNAEALFNLGRNTSEADERADEAARAGHE